MAHPAAPRLPPTPPLAGGAAPPGGAFSARVLGTSEVLERRAAALDDLGRAWKSTAERSVSVAAPFIKLATTLVEVKLALADRGRAREAAVFAAMRRARDAHVEKSPDVEGVPELHAMLAPGGALVETKGDDPKDTSSRTVLAAMEAECAKSLQQLLTIEGALRGKAFEAYPEANWLPDCLRRDAFRRDFVILHAASSAGRGVLREQEQQGSADVDAWAARLDAALRTSIDTKKEPVLPQTLPSSLAGDNNTAAVKTATDALARARDLTRANSAAKRRRELVHAAATATLQELRNLASASTGPGATSGSPNVLSPDLTEVAAQQGLHARRLRLAEFMRRLTEVNGRLRELKPQVKEIDSKLERIWDTMTEAEQNKAEDDLQSKRDQVADFSRCQDGLRERIRELCLDSISWQRRHGGSFAMMGSTAAAVQSSSIAGGGSGSGSGGEAKTDASSSSSDAAANDHDTDELSAFAESSAFPDVWHRCKSIITGGGRKRARGRRNRRGSSTSSTPNAPNVDKVTRVLEKLGLFLHGRSREDYSKEDLPETMIEGTKSFVHVDGCRLRGVPRPSGKKQARGRRRNRKDPSLKILKKIVLSEEKRIRSALVYANRLKHPFVVKVEGAFIEDENLVVQTPFYAGGNLEQWCAGGSSGVPREDRVKALLFGQAAEGTAFLHDNKLIHRDIKPGNIVMTSDLDDACPALIDFDLSKSISETDLLTMSTRAGLGTERYMAPELFTQPPSAPSFETDVYALGVTFFEVFLSECSEHKLLMLATEAGVTIGGVRPDWGDVIKSQIERIDPSKTPKRRELLSLIQAMLSPNPKNRPSAKEVARRAKAIARDLGSHECFACSCLFESTAGLVCAKDAAHFLCYDCLNQGYFKTTIDETSCETFACSVRGCDHVFKDADVLKHMSEVNLERYKRKRAEVVATATREEEKARYEEEMRREAAKSALQKEADKCRKFIEEEIMTIRCPRCKRAFSEYEGCAALTCSGRGGCGCAFCAVCLRDCGSDAHACAKTHAETRHTYYMSLETFNDVQLKRKAALLARYWRDLPENVRELLSSDQSVQQHFEDLRMPAPGRAGRAAVQFAQELAHLRGMGLVADAADENEAVRVLDLVGGDVARAAALLLG